MSARLLADYIFLLAKAAAKAIFGTGSWSDCDIWTAAIKGWFDYQLDAIVYEAWWYANEFYGVLRAYAVSVSDFANAINTVVKQLVGYWNNYTLAVVTWYQAWYYRLTYVAQSMYGWLYHFFNDQVGTINTYLGSAWTWAKTFYYNQYNTVSTILGAAWSWVRSFYSNQYNTVAAILGSAWTWLRGLYLDQYHVITTILGAAWLWVKSFYNAPFATVDSWTGGALSWLLDLFGIKPQTLLLFVADAMVYWYNLWSTKRAALSSFLSDPTAYILAALYHTFLDWFEQLIADNW